MGLKYVGDGSAFLGIPAKNLSETEIKEIERKGQWKKLRKFLLESGMYIEAEKPKPIKASAKKEE